MDRDDGRVHLKWKAVPCFALSSLCFFMFLGERTLVTEFQGTDRSHRTGHDYQEGELPRKMCVM